MKAIVTGSSRGLGLAISKAFVQSGYDVAISSRKEPDVKSTIEKLQSLNPEISVIGKTVDFESAKSIEDYLRFVYSKWGEADVLVNNVGIYMVDKADENIEKNLEHQLNVNLLSAVRMNRGILESMKNKKKGFIFHVISIAAKNLREDSSSYSISKAALMAYNNLLRESVKGYGIRVIGIYPGPMNTSSWDGSGTDQNKLIQVEDVTSSILNVLKLSSNASVEEIVLNTLTSY